MKKNWLSKCLLGSMLALFFTATDVHAQLNTVFKDVFDEFLSETSLSGSPGEHATHFNPASNVANDKLIPALESLIAGNVSSFPLSSTSVGISFDLSSGRPVSVTESLGPIFAESGKTLGRGTINAGVNFTYLNFSRFRGIRTEDIGFTFTHQDVGVDGLGDNPNESDIMNVNLNLDMNAGIFAFFLTFGITDHLDIGLAIPMINLKIQGNAQAEFNSFTFANSGVATHYFGGTSEDPTLTKMYDYDELGSGIGDLAVRLKYSFSERSDIDFAALIDARLPTGDEENFLGTGVPNVRVAGILSRRFDGFTPHLNLGYDYRGADLDSDEIEFALGFDQKIASGFSFAMDILGEIDLGTSEQIFFFFGEDRKSTATIVDHVNRNGEERTNTREIELTNIPNIKDHVINAALGFRYAPSENFIFLGNVLVPLNDGGLRSSVAPTLGLAVSF